MKNRIRITLIEDNENYRKGIVSMLDRKPGMEVISQYGTAEFALRSLQEMPKENLPDIILLDLNLPGISGLEAVPLIREQAPNVKIIILTQSDKEADVLRAIRMGAAGYLLKSASSKELTEGIELVHSGGATLDKNLAGFILNTLSERLPEAVPRVQLSKREMAVLKLIAEGQAQEEIASRLKISTHNVSETIQNIYTKLDVQNAPAAIAKAYRSGIFSTGIPRSSESDAFINPDHLVREAELYLQEHLKEPLSVPDVAAALGVSRRSLETSFQDVLGCSPHQKLIELRLDQAVALLTESPLPVEDIAAQCGFCHSPHLNRVFKKKYGMPPLAYRKDRQPD